MQIIRRSSFYRPEGRLTPLARQGPIAARQRQETGAARGCLLALTLLGLPVFGLACTDSPKPRTVAAQNVLASGPEIPSIIRDVHLTEGGQFSTPVIPALRTSADGRIAVDMKKRNPDIELFLLSPESTTEPVTDPDAAAGPHAVIERKKVPAQLTYDLAHYDPLLFDQIDPEHRTLCDPTPQFFAVAPSTGAHPCGTFATDPMTSTLDQDCYSLVLITSVQFREIAISERRFQLWSKPITVVVDNPKRWDPGMGIQASIVDLDLSQPAVAGPEFFADSLLEPSITEDGRMIVGRLGRSPRDPNDGSLRTDDDRLDVVYAVHPDDTTPCDVTQWTTMLPISEAYYDPDMSDYGVAQYRLRDPQGGYVPRGADANISYPWIDRNGDNLFFTTIDATLFNDDSSGALMQRYGATCFDPLACALPVTPSDIPSFESTKAFRGVGFAGLWSHGKMVLLDNTINNIDYGLGRADADQLWLDLYAPNTNPGAAVASLDDATGAVRIGTGRDNGNPSPHPLSTSNSAFIDSLEQRFNHNENLRPLTVRDVVWTLNTGKTSAELAFDDYMDPGAVIVAEMTAALEHQGWGTFPMTYHDGFDQVGTGVIRPGGQAIRLQNSATTLDWNFPAYGEVQGDVRLEPVALGGIEGKGLWLDGVDDAITFSLPAQSLTVDSRAWFLGLFIDPRFSDDGVHRQLLRFPQGETVELSGLSEVVIKDAAGVVMGTLPLTGVELVNGRFNHLAFVIDYPASESVLYVNGLPFQKFPGFVPQLFGVIDGKLTVGDADNDATPGFVGWIDELKLLANDRGFEVHCNHARGTLMGVTPLVSQPWRGIAQAHPAVVHAAISAQLAAAGQPTYAKYVCFRDYAAPIRANPRYATDPQMHSVREGLLFPEGPLVFNVERPDSSTNPFCLSCHHVSGFQGLGLSALDPGAPGVLMADDPRRQPMMSPRLIFGNVPAFLFGSGPLVDEQTHYLGTDQFMFP